MRSTLLPSLIISFGIVVHPSVSDASCDPRVASSPTHFPQQSQLRGQAGIVYLKVKVDESGRVSGTQLLRSSGFRLLDRAAAASVREGWVFDVSGCSSKDFPASDLITVEYRRDPK